MGQVPIYDRVQTIIIIIKETPSVCPAPPCVTFSAPSAIKRNSMAVFNIIYIVEEAMHIKRTFFLKYMRVQLFPGSLKTKENYLYRSENIFGVLSAVALLLGIYMEIGDRLMVIYGD